jgi:hypothetical protein
MPCRCVVPISALFSGTLWLGNAAYLYLSVAFIQMLKVRPVECMSQHLACSSVHPCSHFCLVHHCYCYWPRPGTTAADLCGIGLPDSPVTPSPHTQLAIPPDQPGHADLQATMPITVFSVGVMMGTEKFSMPYAANMMLVGVGVATASYGERQAGKISTLVAADVRLAGWPCRSTAGMQPDPCTCPTAESAVGHRTAQHSMQQCARGIIQHSNLWCTTAGTSP